MGDRTYVTLRVLNEHADQARELGAHDANEESSCDGTTAFGFEEVNYATLDFEALLVEAGIAYSKTWDAGSEYPAGREDVRFRPDGTCQHLQLDDGDENPPIDKLLELRSDPAALVDYITKFAADTTPLSWDNQAEYGRLYVEKEAAK